MRPDLLTPQDIARFKSNAERDLAEILGEVSRPVTRVAGSNPWGNQLGQAPELTAEMVAKLDAAGKRMIESLVTSHGDIVSLFPEKTLLGELRSYIQAHANIATIEGVDASIGQMSPKGFLGSAVKSLRDSLPERIGHSVQTPTGQVFVQDMTHEEHQYRRAIDRAAKKLGQAVESSAAGWSEMGRLEKFGVGAGGALASLLFLVGVKQTWDAAHAIDPATGQQKMNWNQAMLGALNLAFGGMIGAGVAMQLGKGR